MFFHLCLQVPRNFLEAGLVDLHQISLVPSGLVAPDDSWEWDETDMTITEPETQETPEPDLTHNLPTEPLLSDRNIRTTVQEGPCPAAITAQRAAASSEFHQTPSPQHTNIYQVYNLHHIELYQQPQFPPSSSSLHKTEKGKQHLLLKSLSKDSSFSSMESLPDLLGGLMPRGRGGDRMVQLPDGEMEREGGRGSGQSSSSQRSESESGIVSDTGETETMTEREDVTLLPVSLHKDGVNQRNLTERRRRRDEMGGEGRRHGEEEIRGVGEKAVGILTNGMLMAADSTVSFPSNGDITVPFVHVHQASSAALSQGSSLESLLGVGAELFPSKDLVHRSASLESGLAPCHSAEETGGSVGSLAALEPKLSPDVEGSAAGKEKKPPGVQGDLCSGELSRRTLDLLKRLENIQSPLLAKMTRSVSDMSLRSGSPSWGRLPNSPSLGGQHPPLSSRKGPPSLINESSATASLTELSSAEDSSLGSEDLAVLRNQRQCFLDPSTVVHTSTTNRKCCQRRSQRAQKVDEADGTSLSMVVNVSCTSACTDEDEDDSDLLSSSTLTLTEEELGVRDGEDEDQRLSGASSGNEDDEDDDEEVMEESYMLGLDYMKRELQSWIRAPRTSSRTEAGLWDELQCGTISSSNDKEQRSFQIRSAAKLFETNSNSGNKRAVREQTEQQEEEANRRNATRSYISQFVDDVENGNVDQSCLKGKDEDDELLREESNVFMKKGETLHESYMFAKTTESLQDVGDLISTESKPVKALASPSCELLSFPSNPASSLVGQLKGELPCHSSALPSPPSLSSADDSSSQNAMNDGRPAAGTRKAITIQEKFKFSSVVTEESRRELRDKHSSLPPKKWRMSHSSCCHHLPSPSALRPRSVSEGGRENVHDFVMEIIDMTSVALKSKEVQDEELNPTRTSGSVTDQCPGSLAQIREKVPNHHRGENKRLC